MKKIIILTAVVFLVFTGLSFAAQKTLTKYMRAGDMGTFMPVNNDDFESNGSTPAINGSLPDNLIFGANAGGTELQDTSGSYFYSGDSDISYCVQGKCQFWIGVRIYYGFSFSADASADSHTKADGLTFIIVNGLYNTKDSAGGSPTTTSMGELLGYGGPGLVDGLGLRPPKIGIEFDTYPNPGITDVCAASSRNDDPDNHVALLFWGDTIAGNCNISGINYPKTTFDDNRHATAAAYGSTNNPKNSYKNDGTGGYYSVAKGGSTYNWLEDDLLHHFRLEIIRGVTPDGNNKYPYSIKAWIDCPSCTADQLKTFKDVSKVYTDLTSQINRTVLLTATDHVAFESMLFGWAFASGGSTQTIHIRDFDIYFPKSPCSYYLASASYDSAAHPGNVKNVLATSGCAWAAVSNSPLWLTIVSGSGTGNGTVTYNVASNTGGPARTGKITIGNQSFEVKQSGYPTCTLVASPSNVVYNTATTLTWTINGDPANGSWTGTPGGTCGAFSNSNGGSCTTSARTTPGANTFTLNVTNTYGSSNCSTIVYVGCANYQVWNGLGGTRDFRINSGCRSGIGNNNELTQATNRLLPPAETIQAYASAGTCTTALGIELWYIDAMNADIVINGGDGDCQVNFTGNRSATNH